MFPPGLTIGEMVPIGRTTSGGAIFIVIGSEPPVWFDILEDILNWWISL